MKVVELLEYKINVSVGDERTLIIENEKLVFIRNSLSRYVRECVEENCKCKSTFYNTTQE